MSVIVSLLPHAMIFYHLIPVRNSCGILFAKFIATVSVLVSPPSWNGVLFYN